MFNYSCFKTDVRSAVYRMSDKETSYCRLLCHSQRVYCIYRCRLLTQRRETRWSGTINDNIVSYDKTSVNNICLFRVSSIKVSLRCCLLTQLVIRIQPRCFLKPLSESGIRKRYFWIFILLTKQLTGLFVYLNDEFDGISSHKTTHYILYYT